MTYFAIAQHKKQQKNKSKTMAYCEIDKTGLALGT
jgi:hypothetical protein